MKNPQQFIVDTFLSDEEHNLLHLLAKRINPNFSDWYSSYGPGHTEMFQCLICDDVFSLGESMVEHGKQHLILSNLLPFL